MIKGNIHSFVPFGTVDGPGIRFVLFMQGCNMNCLYCHNKDATINHHNILMSVDEVVEEVMKYKSFYLNGGITVSGGEPLLQIDFIIELFTKLKKYQIHTCIDTSGSIFSQEKLLELIKVTDLFLLDLKHFDENGYQNLTSYSMDNTLKMGKFLSDNKKPVILRVVIVPTINDSMENIKNFKKIIVNWTNIQEIDFIPYHKLGKEKWQKLKLDYLLENIPEATTDDIRRVKEIFDSISF